MGETTDEHLAKLRLDLVAVVKGAVSELRECSHRVVVLADLLARAGLLRRLVCALLDAIDELCRSFFYVLLLLAVEFKFCFCLVVDCLYVSFLRTFRWRICLEYGVVLGNFLLFFVWILAYGNHLGALICLRLLLAFAQLCVGKKRSSVVPLRLLDIMKRVFENDMALLVGIQDCLPYVVCALLLSWWCPVLV